MILLKVKAFTRYLLISLTISVSFQIHIEHYLAILNNIVHVVKEM